MKVDFNLYAITSGAAHADGRSMLEVMEQAIKGGVDIVQLRNKTGDRVEIVEQAHQLRTLTRKYNIPFIVNDDVFIAKEVGACGVHIGQEDMKLEEVRQIMGNDAIIGVSTHSLDQAMAAQEGGADYIGAGPVFATPTKPGRKAVTVQYITEVAAKISIPFVAIGGIDLDNAAEVVAAGATRICAVRAITDSSSTEAVCRKFRSILNNESQQQYIDDKIFVNGRSVKLQACSINGLLKELGHSHKQKHIIVELDGELVDRGSWDKHILAPQAHVELIQFVGGG